jgi:hypothetical protein
MSEATGGRRCVFCNASGKMDKEHVLPDWLARERRDLGKGWHQRFGAFGEEKGTWHDEPFTVRVGTVCPRCNQGWMSDLEREVRPWLSPMLHGRGRTYYQCGLTVLATWAAKTALVIGSRAASMPMTPFTTFYRKRRPSDSTRIWMGAFRPGAYRLYRTFVPVHISSVGGESGTTNAYAVTFTVGYALFHIFGNESGQASQYSIREPLAESLRTIWPLPSEPVTWPTPALSSADLDVISNAHGEVF